MEADKSTLLINKLVHVFDSSKDGLWFMGLDDKVQFFNEGFYKQFDLPLVNSKLEDWMKLVHPQDRKLFSNKIQSHKEHEDIGDLTRVVTKYRVRDKKGRYLWIEGTGILVESNNETYMVGCHRDITEQVFLNEYLTHIAYHDNETGLLNRDKWLNDIRNANEQGTVFAISVNHLNHFQRRWGLRFVQDLVALIVKSANEVFDDNYELYRINSELFAILMPNTLSVTETSDKTNQLIERLEHLASEEEILSKQEIGVGAVFVPDLIEQDPVSLLLQIVEYSNDNNVIAIYNDQVKSSIERHFCIRDAISDAIKNDDITIVLQPIVRSKNEEVVSFESLARWHHPTLGHVSPVEFISVAEQQGLISLLGLSVLRQACEFLVNFDQVKPGRPQINVNVSVLQLLDIHFIDKVEKILQETGVDAERIVIEITESHVIDYEYLNIDQLQRLKEKGFSLSLDDFGSGFSSITSIFRLPLKQIKLDKSLVQEAITSEYCRELIKFLAKQSQIQKVNLVAEGIESEEMKALFIGLDVDLLQGYFFDRPMPAAHWLS